MFCRNCGNVLHADAKFCGEYGTEVATATVEKSLSFEGFMASRTQEKQKLFVRGIQFQCVASIYNKFVPVLSRFCNWLCSSSTLAACKIGVASTSAASAESDVPSTYSAYRDVIDIDPEEHDLEIQQAIFQSIRRRSTDQDERYALCSNLPSFTNDSAEPEDLRVCKSVPIHTRPPPPPDWRLKYDPDHAQLLLQQYSYPGFANSILQSFVRRI